MLGGIAPFKDPGRIGLNLRAAQLKLRTSQRDNLASTATVAASPCGAW